MPKNLFTYGKLMVKILTMVAVMATGHMGVITPWPACMSGCWLFTVNMFYIVLTMCILSMALYLFAWMFSIGSTSQWAWLCRTKVGKALSSSSNGNQVQSVNQCEEEACWNTIVITLMMWLLVSFVPSLSPCANENWKEKVEPCKIYHIRNVTGKKKGLIYMWVNE